MHFYSVKCKYSIKCKYFSAELRAPTCSTLGGRWTPFQKTPDNECLKTWNHEDLSSPSGRSMVLHPTQGINMTGQDQSWTSSNQMVKKTQQQQTSTVSLTLQNSMLCVIMNHSRDCKKGWEKHDMSSTKKNHSKPAQACFTWFKLAKMMFAWFSMLHIPLKPKNIAVWTGWENRKTV